MTDRPIPFSDPMAAAVRAGRKTQTRRIILPQPTDEAVADGSFVANADRLIRPAPIRYAVGDRLYVRETYYQFGQWWEMPGAMTRGGRQKWAFSPDSTQIRFDAPATFRKAMGRSDPHTPAWHKRLGRFMPRKASRLTLLVTDVRVQRLQNISTLDALAEGIASTWGDFMGEPPECFVKMINGYGDASGPHIYDNHRSVENFAFLWNSIHGADAWAANLWVVAVSFTVQHGNIDALPVAA